MPILADYHLHSSYSGDSEASMEAMIQKAISMGLKYICFTEHMDLDFPPEDDTPVDKFETNVDAYLYDLLRIRNKYVNDITVGFGLELGLQPHLVRRNVKVAKEHDFDFIIGSAHICNGRDPYYPSFFEGRPEEEAIREYFECIYENLRAYSNFDVFGHMDYIVRYAPSRDKDYCYEKYADILDKILERLISREKGLEINTGAVAYNLREMNPCNAILRRYHEMGGELITVGSDAHTVEDMGRGFDIAEQILKDCGFKYYTVYDGRIPIMQKL